MFILKLFLNSKPRNFHYFGNARTANNCQKECAQKHQQNPSDFTLNNFSGWQPFVFCSGLKNLLFKNLKPRNFQYCLDAQNTKKLSESVRPKNTNKIQGILLNKFSQVGSWFVKSCGFSICFLKPPTTHCF